MPRLLFCENETNRPRIEDAPALTPFPKDGINDHVVSGAPTVNPDLTGTKAAAWYQVTVPAGGSAELRLRLHRDRHDHRVERPRPARARLRDADASPRGRGRRVLRGPPPRRRDRRGIAGHAPGLRRDALEQAVLRLQRGPLARWRPGVTAAAGRARHRAERRPGAISTPPTSCRCPIPGSTRGSRPGTWPSTPSPSPTSTRPSRSTSCCSCVASGSSTRTARCPPTSGRSTT